ncbi:MAG: hypothetical protein HRT45_04565 [Bdellovibrionales bacterium]|nr:hypothetical protein [Bdellovibrionales bacterium]
MSNKQEERKEGEVIEFPKAKVVRHPKLEEPEQKATFFGTPKQKYMMSLGSALLVAVMFNVVGVDGLFQKQVKKTEVGRFLASEEKRDDGYENKLAKKLSQSKGRQPASIGYEPSKIEDFQYGFLGSKYKVSFFQDKVQEVSFQEGSGDQKPEYVTDRKDFMMKRKALWPVEFSSVITKSKQANGDRVFETYSLLADDQSQVGSVEFELDSYGRLYNMKLAKTVQN